MVSPDQRSNMLKTSLQNTCWVTIHRSAHLLSQLSSAKGNGRRVIVGIIIY